MPTPRFRLPALLMAAGLVAAGLALPPEARAQSRGEGDAGAYLAARVAAGGSDYQAAAAWYARAMLADPENPALLEGAVISNINIGEFGLASEAARRLEAKGARSQAGQIARMADAAARGDFAALTAAPASAQSVGILLDGLVKAWAELGNGRMSEALEGFDALAGQKGLEAFGLYHKALALASVGDYEGADEILSGRAAGPIAVMRRGVIAHVQILSQLERNADAIALLERSFGRQQDPGAEALLARLAAGEPVPYDVTRNAVDGISEVFFTLATALNGEAEDGYTLLYARSAVHLRPDHTDALLLAAALLEQQDQHELASKAYAAVPPADPAHHVAEIGRAEAAYNAGQKDAALEILRSLARNRPDLIIAQTALGDALRREERFVEAIGAYDAAIALAPAPQRQHWNLFYARGICHERQKDWPKAEADFRKALELEPDQPQVLNYLGYSFVDRGENLEEALSMIERAVAARPDAGYIIDSLAWAYFRLGRYQDALEPMERASLLEPVDPIVTDHLGDVYWAVGRKREAEFQWHRALSFGPGEEEAIRIRRKLDVGLDAVLAEEGAPPLSAVEAAQNGN